MKTLLLFSICSLLLLCSCEKKRELYYPEKYDTLYTSQLKSGKKMNEIFLGFRFGDTEKQVKARLEELRKQKTLFYNSAFQYCYKLNLDTSGVYNKAIAALDFQYYKGSFYRLTLICTSTESHTFPKAFELYAMNANIVYMRKYGHNNWITNKTADDKGILNIVGIFGNCEINIVPKYNKFEISYTDLTVSKLIEQEANNKDKKVFERTSKDI